MPIVSANTLELSSPNKDTPCRSLINTFVDGDEHPAIAAYLQAETETGGSGVATQGEEEEFRQQETYL